MIDAGGTYTSEGFIPHLVYLGIHCPVRLLVHGRGIAMKVGEYPGGRLPVPHRNAAGQLVYVLPGGGNTSAG